MTHRSIGFGAVALLATCSLAVLPSLAQVFIVRRADLSERPIVVQAVDESQITFAGVRTDSSSASGEVATLPLELLVSLTAESQVLASPKKDLIVLADGQRIAGDLLQLAGDQLEMSTQALGQVVVPLPACREIILDHAYTPRRAQLASVEKDRVLLLNGDSVTGAITSLKDNLWKVATDDGEIEVPSSAIARIKLAQIDGQASVPATITDPSPQDRWRIDLTDGSSLRVAKLAVSGGAVAMLVAPTSLNLAADGVVRVPLSQIRRAENFESRTVSALAKGSPEISFHAMLPSPLPADYPGVTIVGSWIPGDFQVSGSSYSRVVKMRPRSTIALTVPKGYKELRFFPVLAGDSLRHPFAQCDLLVTSNGQVLHRSTVTSTVVPTTPTSVSVPAHDSTATVIIAVEEGKTLNVSDELLILDPVFMRP